VIDREKGRDVLTFSVPLDQRSPVIVRRFWHKVLIWIWHWRVISFWMSDAAYQWMPLGETYNTRYYLAARDIAIIMPQRGLKDDGASARINMEFQTNWAQSTGTRCSVVVCLFQLISQDSEARRIYARGMEPNTFYAVALVVSNPISRAIGSFFIGLTKPGVPTKIVATIDDGIAWCESQRSPQVNI